MMFMDNFMHVVAVIVPVWVGLQDHQAEVNY